jgi:hypothetical protein
MGCEFVIAVSYFPDTLPSSSYEDKDILLL